MNSSRSDSGRGAARETVTLEFRKNAPLAAIAGSHSRHLVRLEQKLGVKIAMRGNLIAIEGEPETREQAAAALRTLYQRAELGEELTLSDVDAEIGFAAPEHRDMARTPAGGGLRTAPGKMTRTRNPAQAAYIDSLRKHELVFGIGPAGTGKTYLAAAFGAHLLHERRVERLILCRPALEAGERLGFLPGDLKEKVDPYLRPLYDALFEVLGDRCVKLMETGVIEVAPLAFMRGRTLARAFVILDEAQNCTPGQMKMCLTRLGEDSRMAVTADPTQSDLPGGPEGIEQALRYLDGVESVAVARFSTKDVVRHALVARIVGAYEAHDKKAKAPRRVAKSGPESQ
jgi:phosphate starvation-inducible protein PhoH and related proteins